MLSNEKRVKELLSGDLIPVNKKGEINYDKLLDEEISIIRFPFHDKRVIFEKDISLKMAAESLAVPDRLKLDYKTSLNIVIGDELLTDNTRFKEAPDVSKIKSIWRDFEDDRLCCEDYEDLQFYDRELNLPVRIYPYMKHIESVFHKALVSAHENGYSDVLTTEYLVDEENDLICCIATHTVAWSENVFDKKVYVSDHLSSNYHKKSKIVSTNDRVRFYVDNYDLSYKSKYKDNVYTELVYGSHIRIEFADVVREAAFAYVYEREFGDDNLPGVIVGIFKMSELDKLVELESSIADRATIAL